jgi:hypothetical protein
MFSLAAVATLCVVWAEAVLGGVFRSQVASLPLRSSRVVATDLVVLAAALHPLWLLAALSAAFAPWLELGPSGSAVVALRLAVALLSVNALVLAWLQRRWAALAWVGIWSTVLAATASLPPLASGAGALVAAAAGAASFHPRFLAARRPRRSPGTAGPARRWMRLEPLADMHLRQLSGAGAPASCARVAAAVGCVALGTLFLDRVDPDQAVWWSLLAGGFAAVVMSAFYHDMRELRQSIPEVLAPLPLRHRRVVAVETGLVLVATLAASAPGMVWQLGQGLLRIAVVPALCLAWAALATVLRPIRLGSGDNSPGVAVLVWLAWAIVIFDVVRMGGHGR